MRQPLGGMYELNLPSPMVSKSNGKFSDFTHSNVKHADELDFSCCRWAASQIESADI